TIRNRLLLGREFFVNHWSLFLLLHKLNARPINGSHFVSLDLVGVVPVAVAGEPPEVADGKPDRAIQRHLRDMHALVSDQILLVLEFRKQVDRAPWHRDAGHADRSHRPSDDAADDDDFADASAHFSGTISGLSL